MVEQTLTMQEIPKERLIKEEIMYTAKSAGFWMRFWAFLLDLLVISAISGILITPIFKVMDLDVKATEWYAPVVILSAVVYFAYFVLMTKFFAQTVGKMVFGLRVVKLNEEKLDWLTVVFREVVGRFISNTFLKIPYLIVIFAPKHQSVHDMIADTLVVHEGLFEQTKEVTPVTPVIMESPNNVIESAEISATATETSERTLAPLHENDSIEANSQNNHVEIDKNDEK